MGIASLVSALVLLCLVTLVASKDASATEPTTSSWYECNQLSKPFKFEDANCTKEVATGAKWSKSPLEVGKPQALRGTNIGGEFTMKYTNAGLALEDRCSTASASGTVENQAGPTAGGQATIAFSGCTVRKPEGKGCKFKGGGFTTSALTLVPGNYGGGGKIGFRPTEKFEGRYFIFKYTIENCTTAALNGTFAVGGSMAAVPNDSIPGWTFTAASTQLGEGVAYHLEGSIKTETQETTSGGAWRSLGFTE